MKASDRSAEGDEAGSGREVTRAASRDRVPASAISPAAASGESRQSQAAYDHPRSVLRRSTSSGTRLRFSATIRPSPTTTSDAATAITASAKI